MTSRVKSIVQEEKKEIPILSPRLSTTTQRAKIITKERNVKIRIPWWNELINKEESEPNADDENGKEDPSRESTSKTSKHGRESGKCDVIYKQEIPNDSTPAMTTDDKEVYESENEYHDAMSELRELTKRFDINKDHNNPKSLFLNKKYTDDETDEDEEYQEPLINVE